ncbi:MAG: SET domain-containing protein [Bacteroidota bacterium]
MIFNESKSIIVDSQSDVAEKRTDSANGRRSLFSRKNFKTGEVISTFYWDQVFPTPTYLTVQISEHEHILLQPEYLECINHSCNPNAFFDTTRKHLIAVRPIKAESSSPSFIHPPSGTWTRLLSVSAEVRTASA